MNRFRKICLSIVIFGLQLDVLNIYIILFI